MSLAASLFSFKRLRHIETFEYCRYSASRTIVKRKMKTKRSIYMARVESRTTTDGGKSFKTGAIV